MRDGLSPGSGVAGLVRSIGRGCIPTFSRGQGEVRAFCGEFCWTLPSSSFLLRRRDASRSPWGGLAASGGLEMLLGGEVFLGAILGVAGVGVVVALRMVCREVLCL